jgi:hypothetical protein
MAPSDQLTTRRYRERAPVVVDAIRWTASNTEEVYAFIHRYGGDTRYMSGAQGEAFYLTRSTPFGPWCERSVHVGDWLVLGARCERGVICMSSKDFAATYVALDEERS